MVLLGMGSWMVFFIMVRMFLLSVMCLGINGFGGNVLLCLERLFVFCFNTIVLLRCVCVFHIVLVWVFCSVFFEFVIFVRVSLFCLLVV